MLEGIQTRIFGPPVEDMQQSGFVLKREVVEQTTALFEQQLSQRESGPVQMLVEVPDSPASVVNVFQFYGKAAVAHVLRAPPEGNVPALAAVFVMLPGIDPEADEAAIASIEVSKDKTGKPLPFGPKVYQSLRADARPLLGMLFFAVEAVTDSSLRLLGICLANAYFGVIRRRFA